MTGGNVGGDESGHGDNFPDLGELARFISRLDNLGVDPGRLCSFLLYAGVDGQPVPASALSEEFDVPEGAARQMLDWVASLGGVWYPSEMEDTVRVDRPAMGGLVAFLDRFVSAMTPRQRAVLAGDQLDRIELTIATPPGFDGGDSDMMAQLAAIVTGAEDKLLLVTPFFTRFAVESFVDRVVTAADDGVTVSIITRDTDAGDNAEAVEAIHDAAVEEGVAKNIEIFDYGTSDQRLHAKVLVADEEVAYVGSANMTSYSLQEAVEVGVIIDGPSAGTIAEFFRSVKAAGATDRIY